MTKSPLALVGVAYYPVSVRRPAGRSPLPSASASRAAPPSLIRRVRRWSDMGLTGAFVERTRGAELPGPLGYEPGAPGSVAAGNARNGTTPKTLTTDQGDVAIETPRDRNGRFEPQLVKKHQRRFTDFDDKILSMYARGMSVRDIPAHLSEIYGTDISPRLISTATDALVDEVAKSH